MTTLCHFTYQSKSNFKLNVVFNLTSFVVLEIVTDNPELKLFRVDKDDEGNLSLILTSNTIFFSACPHNFKWL